jgi:hypothetical protein
MEINVREISNGYIVKFDFGYMEDKNEEYFEDKEYFCFTMHDVMETIMAEMHRVAGELPDEFGSVDLGDDTGKEQF